MRTGRPRAHTLPSCLSGVFCLAVLVVILSGCHPLINPNDPNSVTYTGVTSDTGEAQPPEPLLPAAAKWELIAIDGPATPQALEISEDGEFVEPRDSLNYQVRITLSDSFFDWQATGAILWAALAVEPDIEMTTFDPISDRNPIQRTLTFNIDSIPDQARILARLTDRNGTNLGDRTLSRLVGDVDGNAVVESDIAGDNAADLELITELNGFLVNPANPMTIRADIDLNGMVETSGADWGIVEGNDGNVLPAEPPEDIFN